MRNRLFPMWTALAVALFLVGCGDSSNGNGNGTPDLTEECTDICEVWVSCGLEDSMPQCMDWCQAYYEIRLPAVVDAMRGCAQTTACGTVDQCYDESEQYCTNDPTDVFELACNRDLVECDGIPNPTTQELAACVADLEQGYEYETCMIDSYLDVLADCLETLESYCDWDWPIETCEDTRM